MENWEGKSLPIHLVSSTDSTEFTYLKSALSGSSVIGLDAEWKPIRSQTSTFPQVSVLQIACRLEGETRESVVVFLLDLFAISLDSVYQLLKQVFESPHILKLGFRFKQDFVYLSSTFASHASLPGFDRMDSYLDITSIYNILQNKHTTTGRKISKQNKSLATICKDLLGVSLSKELQCSDWSCRPLTEEQMQYAAADAFYLLRIFDVFCCKFLQQGNGFSDLQPSYLDLGLKIIFEEPDSFSKLVKTKFCSALEMIQATIVEVPDRISTSKDVKLSKLSLNTTSMDGSLLEIVRRFGDIIELKESDRKPKGSKRNERRQKSIGLKNKEKRIENIDQWEGPPPWDLSLGGDGFPKFLCDVMVEGLAKHLRCVGIDAAVPNLKKPDNRNLIEQAYKEKRVLLTRDVKLFKHEYLIRNQIYRVKSLLKNEQLVEVIDAFQLNIREDQLMSRCTKCNGSFIQKPLSTEEAIEAAKGFQVIPNCLFNKNLEFWQCKDCNQLYWEGTQYHNALQKFIDVCKLN